MSETELQRTARQYNWARRRLKGAAGTGRDVLELPFTSEETRDIAQQIEDLHRLLDRLVAADYKTWKKLHQAHHEPGDRIEPL